MKNFLKLATALPVMPLLTAIHTQDLWDKNTLRTTHPDSPHKQASDIWLRFQKIEADVTKVIDAHESVCYPAWYLLPLAQVMIFDLMRAVNGTRLGRVMITRLAPGKKIEPHEDGGDHARYYKRFHIMLQNQPGSIFDCGDESVYMEPGSVWYFNNQITHAVVNNSSDDRITMIVDIQVPEALDANHAD